MSINNNSIQPLQSKKNTKDKILIIIIVSYDTIKICNKKGDSI